jgi:hypothetical protein
MIPDSNNEIDVFDVERIMGDLPIEVIKENILTQIDNPLLYTSDYADDVYLTLENAKKELGQIDQYNRDISEEYDKFSLFLLSHVSDRFNLGIDVEVLDSQELNLLAYDCYKFFIVYLKEDLENFLYNYIISNKEELGSMFDSEYKRKDVTTMNMKKACNDKNDILILSNLSDVINYILNIEFDASEFIELCIEPGEELGEKIKEWVQNFTIPGDFVSLILDELRINHNDLIDEFVSSIRLYMIEDNQ